MASIDLRQVTKRYPGGHEAVKSMDLDVVDGEFMILVGPSGCGKSTALRMIAGLEEISEGELRVDGELVNDRAPKDRDIAMVFQNYALYPHMTVAENLGFALRLSKVPRGERDRIVAETAAILDLQAQLERKPSQLSGGQRQRVAMGRAIVRHPKAFLMDEPLSNLDAKLRVQMRMEVARIQRRLGTTTIYVTHDQTEAMTLGDRVAVMRSGVIQQIAPPQELYAAPVNVFVAGFIGSPAMNFLPAELTPEGLRLPIGVAPLPDRVRRSVEASGASRLVAGIRPECFQDAGLVRDGQAARGIEFDASIELTESMGSDLYAYFTLQSEAAAADDLADLGAQELEGAHPGRVVARLAPASRAAAGSVARLWMDAARLHVFDGATGLRLTPSLT